MTTLCGNAPSLEYDRGSWTCRPAAHLRLSDDESCVTQVSGVGYNVPGAVRAAWECLTSELEDGAYLRVGRRNVRWGGPLVGFLPYRGEPG